MRGLPPRESSACEIRCSLPLAGREEPQTSMAMPLSISDVPSSRTPSRSRCERAMNWNTVASDSSAAKSSTGVPTALKASFQSATAVSLATRSPTPASQRISGAARQISVSIATPKGMVEGRDLRLPSSVRLDCGLQKPSLDSDVGTAM